MAFNASAGWSLQSRGREALSPVTSSLSHLPPSPGPSCILIQCSDHVGPSSVVTVTLVQHEKVARAIGIVTTEICQDYLLGVSAWSRIQEREGVESVINKDVLVTCSVLGPVLGVRDTTVN